MAEAEVEEIAVALDRALAAEPGQETKSSF
jgi:hypothetical protein